MRPDHLLPGEDSLLLRQLYEGNSKAFDAIYEKYWHQVYSTAFKRLKNADQARDVTQDVFLKLWLNRSRVRIKNLQAYLFTAVRNNVYKWMEKEQKFTPIPELLLHLKTAPDRADAGLLEKEFMKAYEALIDMLTPSQQEIFRLRYHQGLSTAEIAGQLGISRKTVQNQLGKALARLQTSLPVLYIILIFP